MRVSADNSPMALTDSMEAALRVVVQNKLLDAAGVNRACGDAYTSLGDLCRRGLVKVKPGAQRDGKPTTLYIATDKGVAALERHVVRIEGVVSRARAWDGKAYKCPEMGRTCHRPGAYDALALPSMIGSERRTPKATR